MVLFIKKQRLIPLEDLLAITTFQNKFNLEGSVSDSFAWQAYIEAAAFVRWIIETRGWAFFWEYYTSPEETPFTESSIGEVEKVWMKYEKNKRESFVDCRKLLDQTNKRFKVWCSVLGD